MIAVNYDIEIPYLSNANGGSYPGIVIQLKNPSDSSKSMDLAAELDSGAEYSLFDGAIAGAVGLALAGGAPFKFKLMNGSFLDAKILSVILAHPDLGNFPIDLRFSVNPVQRNVLGRDFFDLVQIGFREHAFETYLTSTP